MLNQQLLQVTATAFKVCGPDVTVKQANFDAAAFVIQPCDYDQFSLVCEKLKGSGHFIKPFDTQKGTGCICNVGQY